MSFFSRAYAGSDAVPFSPFFHILSDLDAAASSRGPQTYRRNCAPRSFTPKFDVKESADSYQLEGELAGVSQENIDIQFSDAQTLVVRGRTTYSRSTSNASTTAPAAVEKAPEVAPEVEPESEKTDDDAVMVESPSSSSHHATVEDEEPAATPATTTATVAAPTPEPEVQKSQGPQAKYWLSERSVGQFTRSFTFSDRVDHDAVTASLTNGILSIVVPKAKVETRKITIH